MPITALAQKNRLLWLVYVAYVLLILLGLWNHEMAEDEAQAWLIARDNTIAGILKILPSEGHPPLWYIILFFFSHAGMPYVFIKLIPAILTGASLILLQKSNIPFILKLVLPFSYFFLFEYTIIVRNYTLLILFISCIIYNYPRRFDQPFLYALSVAGLFNAHVLIFAFTLSLCALYIFEMIILGKTSAATIAACTFMLVSGLYLIPYLATSTEVNFLAGATHNYSKNFLNAISQGITITDTGIIALLLFIVSIVCLFTYPAILVVAVCGLLGTLYILTYHYAGATRHHGVLYIIIVASYCIAANYTPLQFRVLKKELGEYGLWVLLLIIAIQFPFSASAYIKDVSSMYSGSEDAAQYLADNELDSRIIVGQQALSAEAVLPYLKNKKQFYYSECERWGSYYIYDTCFTKRRMYYAVEFGIKTAYEKFKGKLGDVIFLFNYPVKPEMLKYVELIYYTPRQPVRYEEQFYIYKFRQGIK